MSNSGRQRTRREGDTAKDRYDKGAAPATLVDASRPAAAAQGDGKDERGEIERLRAELRASEALLAAEQAGAQILQAISTRLIQQGDLDGLHEQLLDAAIAMMRSDMGSMQMFSPDRNALRLLAWKGFHPDSAAFWEWVVADSTTSCGRALRAGERVLIVDAETSDFMAGTADLDHYHLSGIRAVQSTPLLSRTGDVVGMISTHWREPHQPAERELRMLDVLARQAADHIERTRAEAALRDRETRLRLALDASSSGTFIWYVAEDRGEPDAQMLRLFGLPPDGTLNLAQALDRMLHVDDRARYAAAVARAADPDGSGELREDIRVLLPGGTERWLAITAQAFFQGGQGEPRRATRMAGTATDITERKWLERQTHEALEALLAMAEALVVAPEALAGAVEERVRGADAPASEPQEPHKSKEAPEETPKQATAPMGAVARATIQHLMALTQKVLQGQYTATVIFDLAADTIHPLAVVGLTPEIEQRWWRELSGATASAYLPQPLMERLLADEVVLLNLAGQPPIPGQDYFGVQTTLIVPVRLGAHRLLVLGAEIRNRPAFMPQEVELARAAARLVGLVIERERLQQARAVADARELAAREASERMRTFVGIAGHELRTPVTSVRASVQLAERTLRNSLTADLPQGTEARLNRVHDLLERAEGQILRLNRLIEDMLDMTRITEGKLELRLATDDLGDVVREAVETQRLAWPSRTIELAVADAPLAVSMDADRVGQVVTNYLTNALKYAPEDHPVAVAVTIAGGVARVAVRDQGPGLAPEAQARLWEPFHQVEGIRQQSGTGIGLGLGLHISKTIVERHGGAIGVESAVGQGSTFWFTLPLARP